MKPFTTDILTLFSTNLAFGERLSWASIPSEFALRDARECEMLLLSPGPGAELTGEAGVTGLRLLLAGTERCLRNLCSLLMITFPSDDESPASKNKVLGRSSQAESCPTKNKITPTHENYQHQELKLNISIYILTTRMLLPKDGRDLVPFWLIGSCLLFSELSSSPSFVCGVSIWLEEFFSPVMKKVFIPSTKHKNVLYTKCKYMIFLTKEFFSFLYVVILL